MTSAPSQPPGRRSVQAAATAPAAVATTTMAPAVDTAQIEAELIGHGLKPATAVAIVVAGSLARGWHHAKSDVDVYIVSTTRWDGEATGQNFVQVEPETVPTNTFYVAGRRWEVRYWLDSQVEQVLQKVSWARFEDGGGWPLNPAESALLARLPHAKVVSGRDWVVRRAKEIASSAFQTFLVANALNQADGHIDDALGLLESGDDLAAVTAARLALDASVDALASSRGETGAEGKWRSRRVAAINTDILPWETYRDIITMRSFDPNAPGAWVESVLRLCRRIATQIEI